MLHMMGFPHSDTCGSRLICSSPQLFAAYRVLLRLPMPRHSPYALFSLNFMSFANLFLRSKCFVTLLSHCLDLSIFHSLRCSIVTLCVSTLFVNITRFAFSPFVFYSVFKVQLRQHFRCLVGSSGLEPPTLRLSGARSSLLSYEPVCCSCLVLPLVEMKRFELLTPCLQGRCSPN